MIKNSISHKVISILFINKTRIEDIKYMMNIPSNIYTILSRLRKNGIISKEGEMYYLTFKGRCLYLCKSLDISRLQLLSLSIIYNNYKNKMPVSRRDILDLLTLFYNDYSERYMWNNVLELTKTGHCIRLGRDLLILKDDTYNMLLDKKYDIILDELYKNILNYDIDMIL